MDNVQVSLTTSVLAGHGHLTYSVQRESPGDPQTDTDLGDRTWGWFLRNTDTAWVEEEHELGQT